MAPTVLVTRDLPEPLAAHLRSRGLHAVHVPLIALRPIDGPPPAVLPAQVLLTSRAGVDLANGLAAWVGSARVVAVGQATATAAQGRGLAVHEIGHGGATQALSLLSAELTPTVFVGAARPAPAMQQALDAGTLLHWAVYDRSECDQRERLAAVHVQLVTLTSPSAAHAYARQAPSPRVPVICIGHTTAEAARLAGLDVRAVSQTPSLEQLADLAARLLS